MKKYLTATLIALILFTSSFASTGSSAASKAAAHLEVNYASAKNVTWTYTDKYEKACITIGKEKVYVYYDEYGNFIGSTKTMAFDKLPKQALEILTTEYTFPDYQLTDCIEFTDSDGNTNYYVSFDLYGENVFLSITSGGAVSLADF